MTPRERAEAAQNHDINADNCAKHNEPLYCHQCYACAAEAIKAAIEECAKIADREVESRRLALKAANERKDQVSFSGHQFGITAAESIAEEIRALAAK